MPSALLPINTVANKQAVAVASADLHDAGSGATRLIALACANHFRRAMSWSTVKPGSAMMRLKVPERDALVVLSPSVPSPTLRYLSSRHLLPGSSAKETPEQAVGWIL
jgi:hypothetical protein